MITTIDDFFEKIDFSDLDISSGKSHPQILGIVKLPVKQGAAYLIKLFEGRAYGPHQHETSEESVHIFRGKGRVFCQGRWFDYEDSSKFYIPQNDPHRFEPQKTTYLLSIQTSDVVGDGKNMDIKK